MTFSTEQNTTIAGVILAGGLATRMGGGDKTQKVIGNRKILNIVIERISPQVSELALNTNNDPSHYSELGLPLLSDAFEERYGPLAGILAGMDWAHNEGFGLVVTIAGDTPFFPDDLVFRLLTQHLDSNARIILAATRDQETDKLYRHPTFGLWSVDLRHDLRENLKREYEKSYNGPINTMLNSWSFRLEKWILFSISIRQAILWRPKKSCGIANEHAWNCRVEELG